MPDIAARLLALDTCAVSDALDKLGLPGAVIGITPDRPGARRGQGRHHELGAPLPNLPKRHLGAGAVMGGTRRHHRRRASRTPRRFGLGRAVEPRRVCAASPPFWSTGPAATTRPFAWPAGFRARSGAGHGARRIAEHSSRNRSFGSIAVKPGDYVFADGGGVVFVRSIARGRNRRRPKTFSREAAMAAAIDRGDPIGEVGRQLRRHAEEGLMMTSATAEKLKSYGVTTLSDALDRLGIEGQCLGIMPAFDRGMRLADRPSRSACCPSESSGIGGRLYRRCRTRPDRGHRQ